jgi:hypothetical protein
VQVVGIHAVVTPTARVSGRCVVATSHAFGAPVSAVWAQGFDTRW